MTTKTTTEEAGGVVLLLLALVAWLGWVGWPASGCSIALGVAYWGFGRLKAVSAPPGSAKLSLWRSTVAGAAGTASKAALWAAIGCAVVWLAQLVLALFISAPNPATMAEFELRLADATSAIRAATKPGTVAAAIGVALLFAFLCGAVWPITASSYAKKWLGRTVAMASAVTAFTFVGAGAAGPRYDHASDVLRARIMDNLKELAKARQNGAALHWLASLADEEATRPGHDPAKWRESFEKPLALCARAESVFQHAYEEAGGYSPFDTATYCDEGALKGWIAQRRLVIPANASAAALSPDWLPEFRPVLVEGPPQDSTDDGSFSLELDAPEPPPATFTLRSGMTRLRDLRGLAANVETRLNDAKRARETLVGVANGAVERMIKGMLPEEADALCEYFLSPLLDEVEKRRGPEVRSWLRLLPLARTKAGEHLLAEGETTVQLTPPPSGQDPLGGYQEYLQSRYIRPALDPADLEALGEARAQRDRDNLRERVAAEHALQERYKEVIRARPVEHGIP
jgi:hypothetical protein